MIEPSRVAAFVWSALTSDAGVGGVNTLLAGRIYHDQVPQAAQLPAATITVVSGTDSVTVGGLRAFDVVLLDVRVVGAGAAYGTIGPIADRVDQVLDGLHGTNGGAVVVKLRRDGVQRFVENEAGASFAHIVQTFRSEAYAAP